MLSFKGQRMLIVAPHPDDEVFGCGGLIHRCKREGGEVYVLFLTVGTTADFSKSGVSTMDERMKEIESVANALKLDGYRMALPGNEYHLQLDALPQKRLIDEIERGKDISLQALTPQIVLTPLPNDYNQDHRAACLAMLTATRPTPPTFRSQQRLVLQYELPPSGWTAGFEASPLNFYVGLEEEDIEAKVKALELYPSQLKNPKGPLSVHGVRTLAALRGIHSGCDNAEAFYAKRVLV
ncbi:MAG: PIG-L family deacetylase [Candidatus Peregrinibacteria bacterium]|nr:PIG-L family deacetylase [Candidatus Peregrinibacteria bacterium]